MPGRPDLTGRRFGQLIVSKRAPDKGRAACWECKCECGKVRIARAGDLMSGRTQSCGCRYGKGRIINRVGSRFGRLLVISCAGKVGKDTLWKCLCECGGEITTRATSLTMGHTKSCGRLFREYKASQVGAEHWNWQGGITALRQAIHHLLAYREWRDAVFHRDEFTCQRCFDPTKRQSLNAHHMKPFHQILDEHGIVALAQAKACQELWDTWNGITLCKDCHNKTHDEEKTRGRPKN